MRLSEVMQAAGGATSGAYLEGAYLLRKMTEEEMMQKKALQQMLDAQERRSRQTENGAEVMELDSVVLEEVYTVGIRMDKALENPYSDFDIVLRNDDVICIPEYNGTTRVMGAVLYPNTVTYSEGMNVKQYVKAAGGFDNNARRRRAFVIHINGMVE
jgi:protein involved in polysaccharide export with SLBB domain